MKVCNNAIVMKFSNNAGNNVSNNAHNDSVRNSRARIAICYSKLSWLLLKIVLVATQN